MHLAKPLPGIMVQRYHGWKATTYAENETWYRHLAEEGQNPRAMIISCCDSRVDVISLLGGTQGEFFIHRNIANLVPPFKPGSDHHGTSAAVEYAVTALKVAHIIVLGHSNCGGVEGCHEMCAGRAPELEQDTSFIGRWMDILRPGYERVAHLEDNADRKRALEKEAVLISLENLMGFPFVKDAVDSGHLSLHALWTNTGEGTLENYTAKTGFVQI
ncbi:MAG: carbonic anhydrase [Pseudomonadota bacterium]